jgi:hypothetical protein
MTMGELAVIHEFGAPAANIPARSFLWLGTQRAKKQIKAAMVKLGQDVVKGRSTEQAALRKLAELIQKSMRDTFKNWQGNWAPLSPRTIASKGHDQPLIDERNLYNAIDFEVIMPGGKR